MRISDWSSNVCSSYLLGWLGSSAAASLPVIAIFATALVAVSLWGGQAAAAQLARALSVPADLLRETLSAGEGAGGKLPSAEAGRLDLKGLESEFASMTDAFARKAAIESATLTEDRKSTRLNSSH